MLIKSGGHSLIVDAGSGLMMMEPNLGAYNILLSHLHLDHIIGLSTFASASCEIRVFTCPRDSRPLNEQVFGPFKPPYWPVNMADKNALCIPITEDKPFEIGIFTITPFPANHPDKTLSFHITDGRKSVVHLLDSETQGMNPREYERLLGFCAGADLVVFDAAYSEEDYPKYKGWGHSTVGDGVKLAKLCRPKRVMFSHYSQFYRDDAIDGWKRFCDNNTGCEFIFAHDGLELSL